MKNKLKKCLMFTDIHFGRRADSDEHNKDCLNYIDWIITHIKNDKTIDHIVFLGDWHEQRAAIKGTTLSYSYEAAKRINSLNIPTYIISGNHDLHFRNTRDISTTLFFESFENFIMIDKEITIINDTEVPILIAPYLFDHEYNDLLKYNDISVFMLHAEFKGFIVTGESKTLDHGPDHTLLENQKRIFCGHFHKRQQKDNVFYIGNTFPMNFSDANDIDRGFATYEYSTDILKYTNWNECPSYLKCNLSKLLTDHKKILRKHAYVRCLVDTDISSEEINSLRETFTKTYLLREISFEEQIEEIPTDDNIDLSELELESTEILIEEMLKYVESDSIDTTLLIKRFKEI